MEPDGYLVTGMVAGMPIALCFDTRFEAQTWISLCASQYRNEDVKIVPIQNYALLMAPKKGLQ